MAQKQENSGRSIFDLSSLFTRDISSLIFQFPFEEGRERGFNGARRLQETSQRGEGSGGIRMTMHALPLEERPRERLLYAGADALSLAELLAILLGTGTKGKSVLLLAQEILMYFGGLRGLLEASIEELKQIKGIGEAKAVLLKAAFEIALRSATGGAIPKCSIETPEHVFELAKREMAGHKQEVLLVILRDVKGRMIHHERVAVGTLSEVLIHPREVFYPAVRHRAHSLILVHNHPSGDPTPSQADLELTRFLLQSSRMMGITLDDHLIIGAHSFISLREEGYMGDLVEDTPKY